MRIAEGNLEARGLKVALIAGRFNWFIVEHLVNGAVDALTRSGANAADIAVFKCPGAFEIPQVLSSVLSLGRFDAVVTLGCVIRGATPHFDYVAGEAARGVAELARSAKVPVTFGVLTTDTIEQAVERAGTKAGNKGFDAAMAAIEMASLLRTVGS